MIVVLNIQFDTNTPTSMKLCGSVIISILFSLFFNQTKANDFSSFLSANASLAVVVDHEYMHRRGENIMANFQKILSDIIRENLKNGGINVKYFTWNGVRLKKDFLAAMTVTDCENTWNFYEATRVTSILLIAITDADCARLPLNYALMIPIVDRGEELPQMILDSKMQQILKWKTANVLVDQSILNEKDLLIKSVVHENPRSDLKPISLMFYAVDDALRSQKKRFAIRKILEQFSHYPEQQFIVFSKLYEDIIEVGENLNMFHVYNQWLFFILEETRRDFDSASATQNLEEGANIAFALNETMPECMDTINCTISEISMAFVSSISRMIVEEQAIYGEISDEEWESIRLTKQEKQLEILNYMKDYLKSHSKCSSCSRWRFETAITWGRSQETRKYRPIYRETRNKNFEFINIGYWSPLLGFITQELAFPHMAHYFRNITMDILTLHNPPWQILKKNDKGEIIEHSGIVMELLQQLSYMLNFTYQLKNIKTDDENFLSGNETEMLLGSSTHMIPSSVYQKAQDNRIFLVAVATTIDEPHKKPFNYTIPISVQKYSFISRKPDEISRIYLFTAPFTMQTWACLAGAIILIAPVLYVINRLAPLQHLRIPGLCTVKNCFWYIYGALLQQGGIYLPKADSGRLVVGIWWIVVIVLVTTYCGNLVAFLTFPKFQPSIDYFFQIFQHNKIDQFGLRNGTFFEKYVASSSRKDFHKYLQRAIIYDTPHDENIAAVKRGKRVNVDWRINLQLIIQNHFEKDKDCTFELGKEDFVDEQIGLLVPPNSPYLRLINDQIMRMFRMGFIERWHKTNLPSMDKCSGRGLFRQITNHKVNLDDMQGCFLVLLFGFAVALFVIFIEFWYYRLYVMDREQRQRKSFSN